MKTNENERYIIIGAAGFLGTNIYAKLIDNEIPKDHIITLDTNKSDIIKTDFVCDITQMKNTFDKILDEKCKASDSKLLNDFLMQIRSFCEQQKNIHLFWLPSIVGVETNKNLNNSQIQMYTELNDTLLYLLEFMENLREDFDAPRLNIYAMSSSEVLGEINSLNDLKSITPHVPLKGNRGLYARHKLEMEELLEGFSKIYTNIKIRVYRLFNIFGYNQDPSKGFIAKTIDELLDNKILFVANETTRTYVPVSLFVNEMFNETHRAKGHNSGYRAINYIPNSRDLESIGITNFIPTLSENVIKNLTVVKLLLNCILVNPKLKNRFNDIFKSELNGSISDLLSRGTKDNEELFEILKVFQRKYINRKVIKLLKDEYFAPIYNFVLSTGYNKNIRQYFVSSFANDVRYSSACIIDESIDNEIINRNVTYHDIQSQFTHKEMLEDAYKFFLTYVFSQIQTIKNKNKEVKMKKNKISEILLGDSMSGQDILEILQFAKGTSKQSKSENIARKTKQVKPAKPVNLHKYVANVSVAYKMSKTNSEIIIEIPRNVDLKEYVTFLKNHVNIALDSMKQSKPIQGIIVVSSILVAFNMSQEYSVKFAKNAFEALLESSLLLLDEYDSTKMRFIEFKLEDSVIEEEKICCGYCKEANEDPMMKMGEHNLDELAAFKADNNKEDTREPERFVDMLFDKEVNDFVSNFYQKETEPTVDLSELNDVLVKFIPEDKIEEIVSDIDSNPNCYDLCCKLVKEIGKIEDKTIVEILLRAKFFKYEMNEYVLNGMISK